MWMAPPIVQEKCHMGYSY
ncbi:hypothetical protein ID866_11072 [Astraeus odoratus]|nr:hypothetical protein ID866_11072 [Astraeus odoratus]